jgi:hypothetical protein
LRLDLNHSEIEKPGGLATRPIRLQLCTATGRCTAMPWAESSPSAPVTTESPGLNISKFLVFLDSASPVIPALRVS